MRLLACTVILTLPLASAASEPLPATATAPLSGDRTTEVAVAPAASDEKCRRPDVHQAERGRRVGFKKLNELPDATAYMTVYRTINGCEVPLTIADYRSGRLR